VRKVVSRAALALFVAIGVLAPSALAEGLSAYREFQLGSDLATVIKQTGASPSQTKVVHTRPALIQDLSWRPQSLGPSSKKEAVQEVVFSFYGGILSRIVVSYDRYATEGMTTDDMIEAISAAYGVGVKSPALGKAADGFVNDEEELLAQWEDPQHRFELVRFSYGSSYRLTGILKKLEAAVQAAIVDAKKLDEQEAPQREAARLASEQDTAKSKTEKARLANKATFRP
jgi:hypothetical protein